MDPLEDREVHTLALAWFAFTHSDAGEGRETGRTGGTSALSIAWRRHTQSGR